MHRQFPLTVHGLFSAADKNGKTFLWTRSLPSTAAEKVLGTEGAANPFWSADSQAISFFTKGKLMKVDPSHGLSQALATYRINEGSLEQNGVILFLPIRTTDCTVLIIPGSSLSDRNRCQPGGGYAPVSVFSPGRKTFFFL
jgi:hypothetical protein